MQSRFSQSFNEEDWNYGYYTAALQKLPKWFHLEEPASHNGNLSCWKYVIKLCNIDERCIDKQGTARFQAFWYAGL
jgi:hypothetical protein